MLNSLPNSIKYDSPRKNEMNEFLKHIFTLSQSNNGLIISGDMIYAELKHRYIKPTDKNEYGIGIKCRQNFAIWANRFKNRKIKAFCDEYGWPYWFQFVNNRHADSGEFIKLYIPIDNNHLERGVEELFDFLDREDIEHESKVGSTLRSDNVIVRLYKGDYKSLNKIVDFISKNKYIKEGLNKVNPFIPTINGIGVMEEKGISYNDEISNMISAYMRDCKRKNKTDVNIEDFREFLNIHCYNKDIVRVFEIAYFGKELKTNDNKVNTAKEIPTKKYNPVELLTSEQKNMLLFDALKATYKKYGFNQVRKALEEIIINNNFAYVTNGVSNIKFRERLSKEVNNWEIRDFVFNSVKNVIPNGKINSVEQAISYYCDYLFGDTSMFKLEDICMATLEKYNAEQLFGALKKYIIFDDDSSFTKYGNTDGKINYRESLKYIDKYYIGEYIKRSLMIRGIDIQSMDFSEIVLSYCNALKQGNYEKLDERPKML